jgi:hypothetical protein
VAKGKFSEATIGYRDKDAGDVWKRLFHKPTAGFCDGLRYDASLC